MILYALAFAEQMITTLLPYWESLKHELRVWLGPEPLTYHILPDGRVLHSSVVLPEEVRSNAFLFDPITKHITKLVEPVNGRFKPLPYIGIELENSTMKIDISDWLGEIRACPVPEISAKQVLLLWSIVHNKYIVFDGSTMQIVKSDGTQETIAL